MKAFLIHCQSPNKRVSATEDILNKYLNDEIITRVPSLMTLMA
jgi:hypothetical protein